ncbi:MAG: type II toxin-antitoxin system Phd/YefM family antitoxin [Rhodospirillaceae bacterium]|nr:type II toxin-antitoxin system Phd/YefM family antitoxin [Rhodospirillaceae bacterium]
MTKWPVQDAKAKFSEMLDTALSKGPQVVTRRGVDMAVLVPMEEWQRLSRPHQPSLKELLLNTPKDAAFARILSKRRPIKLPRPAILD